MKMIWLMITVLLFRVATAVRGKGGTTTTREGGINDFFDTSGGDHPFEVQVVSHIDNNGIFGNVFMTQRRPNDHTKLSAVFEGLEDAPGNLYGLYILDYPANRDAQNPCADLGEIYDPDGNLGTSNYTERCQADHTQCAIGDLTTRHGGFNSTDGFIEFGRDFNLPTSGPRSVVGRSIVVRRFGSDDNLACANVEVPTQSRVLRGRFSSLLSGDVYVILPRYDYVDYTNNEKTQIIVDLERIDGGPPNTAMHGWQIQRGYADSENVCDRLDPVLGRRVVPVTENTCSETNHRACPLGDLTAKCGTLSVVNNRMRAFCTDNQLGLVSFSTLDRAVLSILAPLSNRIMECVQLEEQRPTGAIINFRNRRGVSAPVYVHVVLSQLTQFEPTYYRTYMIRLDGEAADLNVYDSDNPDYTTCTNLGDVLGGPSSVANPITSDQFPAGELGPKIGGLEGKRELRTHGLTSSIPISDIIGKPAALTRSDGTIWGCGEVQNYYNAPYTPPDEVVDYLDIWKPPSK